MSHEREGRAIAARMAKRLMQTGAIAVVLQGSFAYGGADKDSDIDLRCIRKTQREHYLIRREGRLLSITNSTAAAERKAFNQAWSAYKAVPSWRDSIILEDPKGIAKQLQKEAKSWSWSSLGDKPDKWAATQITEFAEDTHRLVTSVRRGNKITAEVQKMILAVRLPWIMAVQKRLFVKSENLQDYNVAKVMGARWRANQEKALGVIKASRKEALNAALDLYRQAADEVWPYLNKEQKQVVAHAKKLIDAREV